MPWRKDPLGLPRTSVLRPLARRYTSPPREVCVSCELGWWLWRLLLRRVAAVEAEAPRRAFPRRTRSHRRQRPRSRRASRPRIRVQRRSLHRHPLRRRPRRRAAQYFRTRTAASVLFRFSMAEWSGKRRCRLRKSNRSRKTTTACGAPSNRSHGQATPALSSRAT